MLRIRLAGRDVEAPSAPIALAMQTVDEERNKMPRRSAERDLLGLVYAGLLDVAGILTPTDGVDIWREVASLIVEVPSRYEGLASQAAAALSYLGLDDGSPVAAALQGVVDAPKRAAAERLKAEEVGRLKASPWWVRYYQLARRHHPGRTSAQKAARMELALRIIRSAEAMGGKDHTRWVGQTASGKPLIILADGTVWEVPYAL